MNIRTLQIFLICIAQLASLKIIAGDLKVVVRLSGYWKFSIGDDKNWALPNYNDNNWDKLYVPASWEKNGYDGYNGYAWYRKQFDAQNIPDNTPVYLELGQIDDVDEVYLNGELLGSTGSFPPIYVGSHSTYRRYIIPAGLLKYKGSNTIAIRVFDGWGIGGIKSGSIGISIDADYALIDIPLEGRWKFSTGNRRDWRNPNFDDSSWKNINVPSSWEDQGYTDYDGYACYRKSIVIPGKYKFNQLYLNLGKIDDIDEVYFNGEFIGTVYDLFVRNDFRRNGMEHTVNRLYHIPQDIINYGSKNTIAIVVYDNHGRGGIYEGPIGIMGQQNFERYRNKHHEPESVWELLYQWLMD